MGLNHRKTPNERPTFGEQLIALLKRNILIKKRNRGKTLMVLSISL
jgi:hypothetical protein